MLWGYVGGLMNFAICICSSNDNFMTVGILVFEMIVSLFILLHTYFNHLTIMNMGYVRLPELFHCYLDVYQEFILVYSSDLECSFNHSNEKII